MLSGLPTAVIDLLCHESTASVWRLPGSSILSLTNCFLPGYPLLCLGIFLLKRRSWLSIFLFWTWWDAFQPLPPSHQNPSEWQLTSGLSTIPPSSLYPQRVHSVPFSGTMKALNSISFHIVLWSISQETGIHLGLVVLFTVLRAQYFCQFHFTCVSVYLVLILSLCLSECY